MSIPIRKSRSLIGAAQALPILAAFCAWASNGEEAKASKEGSEDRTEADKKALLPVKAYVGAWKGAGTAKGSSSKEAWGEEAEWSWEFKDGRAALLGSFGSGKFFSAARLAPGGKANSFKFTGTLPDGKTHEEFEGDIDKSGDLVLTASSPAAAGRPGRLTIGVVAKGKRLVLSYQRKEQRESFSPMAEVGLTLKGSEFGKQSDARECIITGGLGTITVSYKGQTYYLCCTGCKAAFQENPEKELAAYKKRKEEEKAEKEKSK